MRAARVTQARLSAYRAEIDAYGDAARSYVEQYIAAVAADNPGATVAELRDEAIGAINDSLNAFGDQAQAVAMRFFEEIVVDGYGIEADTALFDPISQEMVEGGVRYRARRIIEGDLASFARDVADLSRYYIHRSAFENIERNCERNDLRYARVPSGRETCGFCFMLSSRGFVYRSEQAASGEHGYHEHCDCVVVPGFKELPASKQIEGYDPDAMLQRWYDCQDTVGTDKELRDRWRSMTDKQRARYKGNGEAERYRRFVNAQTMREAEIRDFRWLNTGRHSGIEFSDASVRAEKEKRWRSDPGERITAEKLNRLGYRTEFWDDEVHEPNPSGKGTVTYSRPDLSTGVEIKTIYESASENTFKKHMKSARGKRGLRFVVVDLSENRNVSHDDAREWIEKYMKRYGIGESRILWPDGNLERVTR